VPAEELRRGHQFKVHLELKEIKRSYLGIVAEAVGSCPSFCMISSYCMRRKRVFWGNMIAQSLRIPESVVEREFNRCGGEQLRLGVRVGDKAVIFGIRKIISVRRSPPGVATDVVY
jgi:hypothetical protein